MKNQDIPEVELPKWESHKKVHAFKITKVELHDSDEGAILHHAEGYFIPVEVSAEYMAKHKPQAGGYFVLYADGYRSWSPAKAFEEGYIRI